MNYTTATETSDLEEQNNETQEATIGEVSDPHEQFLASNIE